METPEPAECPVDRGGLPAGEAFKVGVFVITGVAGGVLLGRAVAGFARMGLSSIVPVIVHQVLRKPAGSREVVSSRCSTENSEDADFGSVAPSSPVPSAGIDDGFRLDDGESEGIGLPVFIAQETADPLAQEPAPLPATQGWRDLTVSTGGESLSSAEWAARALDEIEDNGRENTFPGYGIHDPEGPVEVLEDDVTDDTAAFGDQDEYMWWPGEEMAMDLGAAPPATDLRRRLQPEEGSGEGLGCTDDPASVVADHELRDDKVPAVDARRNTGSKVDLKMAHRKSADGGIPSHRRISAGLAGIPATVAKAGPAPQQAPEVEVHDAFSAPFPGSPIAGVQAVENPFERGNAARVKGNHPGGLASVLVKGKMSSGTATARGNGSLGKMIVILIVAVAVGGGVFFSWSSLMGTTGKFPDQSSPAVTELKEKPGSSGQQIAGSAANPVDHDFPEDVGVTTSIDDAKLINDVNLPSFRSLE
ncbi:MAG: hypothetical protein VCA55_11585 [Verrucomicrobiales bacterium]